MSFKKDDQVKLKNSTLTGVIAGAAVDGTTFEMQYLVQYTDFDGVPQERYFLISEVEAV
jgi:hypothetical protein